MPKKAESPTAALEELEPKPVEADLDEVVEAPPFDPSGMNSVVRSPNRTQEPGNLSIEAMVVYLGGNPKKSVYYEGSVSLEVGPDGKPVWVPSHEGASSYDFSRIDTRGRVIKSRLTKEDNKPFSVCRHIGHLTRFMEERTEDGAPVFEIRCKPDDLLRIERYARRLLEMSLRNRNQGRAVLDAMGM